MDIVDVIKGREPFAPTFKIFWLMPQVFCLVFHTVLLVILLLNSGTEQIHQALDCANCDGGAAAVQRSEFTQRLGNVYIVSLIFPLINHLAFDFGVLKTLREELERKGTAARRSAKETMYLVIAAPLLLLSLFYYLSELSLGLHDFLKAAA